jgi:DNA-binding GntR family transcriptional regulator
MKHTFGVVYREYTTTLTIWIDCMAARRRRNQPQRLGTNAGHASASSRASASSHASASNHASASSHTSASSLAYDAIRQRILRCKLEPGALINERALMEQISIGRTPIREALLRLSAEQLVIFSGHGIQVAPITFDSISALYTARLHAERLAWRLWLRGADEAKTARLAGAFDAAPRLGKLGDEEGLVDLDFRFHCQVYEECGNPFLSSHLHNLTGLSFRIWFLANPHRVDHHMLAVQSHDSIIAAVKKRDADSLDREVSDHIENAFGNVVKRLKGDAVRVAAQLHMRELS